MSYPEFSDFPPIPQRSAAEADFDTKMSALFQHFATTHRAELIALIDFLKTNSTIIGGALNATTVGLDAPAEGKFTALEAPQLDLVNTVSGVLAVLGASASDLNIGTNSNHPVDLRVAGIRSILLSTNGTKSFYQTDGSTVGVTIDGSGNVNTAGFLAVGRDYAFSPLDVENGALVSSGDVADDRRGTIHLQNVGGTPADGALAVGISFSGVNTRRRRALIASYQDGEDGDPTGLRFYTYVSTASSSDLVVSRMSLDAAGNLGVGVENPSAKAHSQSSEASGISIFAEAVNASFTGDTLLVRTSRAGSSAFDLIDARSNGGSDAEFRVRGDGAVTSDVGFTGGGADYAEYFEWVDGNLAGEDRRGLSVVLDGDKIRLALPGEDPIGVISANPSVIGDGDIDRWKGKYLKDAFGAYIWEDYEALSWTEVVTETETVQEQVSETQERTREVIEVVDGVAVKAVVTETVQVPLFDEFPLVDESGAPVLGGNGSQLIHREPRMVEVQEETTKEEKRSYAADEVPDGVTVPADAERVTQQRRKLNPDYDPSQDYTPRADRPEWDTVGLMGKLRLLKGQPTGTRWIKMRDVSADVEEWLVR